MIATAERIELLRNVALFVGLDDQTLSALAEQMAERTFDAGQTLFYEGTPGEYCFVLAAGRVQVAKQVDTAQEVVLAERRRGHIVGEMALLGGQIRSATVRALERTVALELSKQGLDTVMAAHPEMAGGVIRTLLGYVQSMTAQVGRTAGQALGGGDFLRVEVGQKLGHYHIKQRLGQGGMATVYRAHDTENDREVALKVLSLQLAQQEGFLERFRREAILFSGLQHPHILPVYGFGERGGATYIATKLVSGGTLANRLGRPLPLIWCAHYLDQIAAALDYAHGLNLIHRDVKPRNVLIGEREWCYLADFGIAALANYSGDPHAAPTVEHVQVGTPAYFSPEQAKGEAATAASDLYALGVMLFEMATGKQPFRGETSWETAMAHATQPIPSARKHNPALPKQAEAVLKRALAKKPSDRYSSGAELTAAWLAAIGVGPADLEKMRETIAHGPHLKNHAPPLPPDEAEYSALEHTEAVPPPVPPRSEPEPLQRAAAGARALDQRTQAILYALLGLFLLAAIVSFALLFWSR